MLKTNEKQLVAYAVQGSAIHPSGPRWRATHDGVAEALPGAGGIVYNVKVGDSAYGWAGDHVEPCVSSTATVDNREGGANLAYNYYSCIGNTARIISGDAKGGEGVVTGSHGGCEHVMIDFPDDVLASLTHDDKIQVRALGQGLRLLDYPDVKIHSIAPDLLARMKIQEESGKLKVPVTALVPGALMGSGLGRNDSYKADFDIQTSDEEFVKKHRLDKLRLGDFVAILDYKSYYGWSFKEGALTIGIVVHTDSRSAGHGPGVTTLITAENGEIETVADPDANIANYLGIGRKR